MRRLESGSLRLYSTTNTTTLKIDIGLWCSGGSNAVSQQYVYGHRQNNVSIFGYSEIWKFYVWNTR